jgi:hypothetical protein
VFKLNSQKYIVSGCDLDDIEASMKEVIDGMQVRFEKAVTVKWSLIGSDINVLLSSESEEMSWEDFVFDQLWDEILGAFEIADEEVSFKHVPSATIQV